MTKFVTVSDGEVLCIGRQPRKTSERHMPVLLRGVMVYHYDIACRVTRTHDIVQEVLEVAQRFRI